MQRDSRARRAPPLLGAACAAAVAALSLAAVAAPPVASSHAPPGWPAGTGVGAGPTVGSDPVRPLAFGKLRVVLESTELAVVRSAAGAGVIVHQGNGSDALSFLCYTVVESVPPQRVWFTSSELAGAGKVDGIEAVELPPGTPSTPDCPALPAAFQPPHFDDGLWLGALSPEQKRAYAPALQRGDPWSASFHERRGSIDVVGSLAVDLGKGRAVGLYVAHTTQN